MRTDRQGPPRALSLALVAIGLAASVFGIIAKVGERPQPPDLRGPSEEVRSRIERLLSAEAGKLEPAAANAARVPELIAAVKMHADAGTYQDLLENEGWWASYRSRFPVAALLAQEPLVAVGPRLAHLNDNGVVRGARNGGTSSGILMGDGGVYLATAARFGESAQPASATAEVVLLAVPLEASGLARVSAAADAAVGVSDGTRLLVSSGGAGAQDLSTLVGKEGLGPQPVGDARAGTAWPAGEGAFVVATFPLPAPSAQGRAGAATWLWMLVAGGASMLLGLLAFVLGGRRGAAAEQPGDRADPAASVPRSPGSIAAPAPDPGGRPSPVTAGAGTRRSKPESRTEVLPESERMAEAAQAPLAVAQAHAQPGSSAAPSQLGRYQLIEQIGEGGMAEIFLAAARGAEDFVRYFVVKRMHPHLIRRRDAVNQFIDEARLQADLVHSNIVPVFDFGKAEEEYFLALEYVHGKDVAHIVQQHVERWDRPLPVDVAFYIVHETLEALGYAHTHLAKDGTPRELVHRDVSPGNVLVSYRGEVKLTDFGIAKADNRVSQTEVGMVKGNASFMSPEQARGEAVDLRSDLFSAGLVLYYCLTGQFLYRGETTLNRLLRAAVGPATSQFGQIEQLPLSAAKILRRAIALDPASRYQSAAEFAQDLSGEMCKRTALAQVMDELFPASSRRDLR